MKQEQTGVVSKAARVQNRTLQGAGKLWCLLLGQGPWNFPQFGFLANDYQLRRAGSLLCAWPASPRAGAPRVLTPRWLRGWPLPVGCPEPLLVLLTSAFLFQPPKGSMAGPFPGRCSGPRALRCSPRSEGRPGEEMRGKKQLWDFRHVRICLSLGGRSVCFRNHEPQIPERALRGFLVQSLHFGDFRGGPAVRTLSFRGRGCGFISGWETKIPQALWRGLKKKKQQKNVILQMKRPFPSEESLDPQNQPAGRMVWTQLVWMFPWAPKSPPPLHLRSRLHPGG